jgi:hypothetical protein
MVRYIVLSEASVRSPEVPAASLAASSGVSDSAARIASRVIGERRQWAGREERGELEGGVGDQQRILEDVGVERRLHHACGQQMCARADVLPQREPMLDRQRHRGADAFHREELAERRVVEHLVADGARHKQLVELPHLEAQAPPQPEEPMNAIEVVVVEPDQRLHRGVAAVVDAVDRDRGARAAGPAARDELQQLVVADLRVLGRFRV